MTPNPFPQFVDAPPDDFARLEQSSDQLLPMPTHSSVHGITAGVSHPKPAPTYSATPPAPLDKARRRAKQKAAAKARTAQRMRAKGKR